MEHTFYAKERQFPRIPFAKTRWIFSIILKDPGLTNSPLQLEAQNICAKGIKFLSNKKIPIFESVSIQLLDKNAKTAPLLIEGKVVRVEETDVGLDEKTFGMAVEFRDLTATVELAIIEELKRLNP